MFRSTVVMAVVMGASAGFVAVADAQQSDLLAKTWRAHGGLEQWRKQATFEYTLNGFPLSPQVAKPNHSTVDLKNRHNRIEGVGFTTGFDGKTAWATPSASAVGLNLRFFNLGSFYFIGMPFVFADEGVVLSDGGTQQFQGKKYKVIKVSYKRGVGYTSDDDYAVFIDPATQRLALIHHSVTENPDIERVTWVFDRWQKSDGLLVPAQMTFYPGWNPDAPGSGSTFTIEKVSFSSSAPDPSIYKAPQGAEIDKGP